MFAFVAIAAFARPLLAARTAPRTRQLPSTARTPGARGHSHPGAWHLHPRAPAHQYRGHARHPIEIRGPEKNRDLYRGRLLQHRSTRQRRLHRDRNLTLDGNGTNGPFGVASRGPCHDVTIDNLKIINFGAESVYRRASRPRVPLELDHPPQHDHRRGHGHVPRRLGSIGSVRQPAHRVQRRARYPGLQSADQAPAAARLRMLVLPAGQSRQQSFATTSGAGEQRPRPTDPHVQTNAGRSFPAPTRQRLNDRYEIYGNFFTRTRPRRCFQGEGNLFCPYNLFVNRIRGSLGPCSSATTIVQDGGGTFTTQCSPGPETVISSQARTRTACRRSRATRSSQPAVWHRPGRTISWEA